MSVLAVATTASPVACDQHTAAQAVTSVLDSNLLVTWYGNPRTARMGILGRYSGSELAEGLRRQAEAYRGLTAKTILPAYHLVAIVAQPTPGSDRMWRRRESCEFIDSVLSDARQEGFRLVLDVQVGHSTVARELEYLRPYLEEPDVYLALDPEFDMDPGETPGEQIGCMRASEVNEALGTLDSIVRSKGLPPKVLIVHQFTMGMLPDRQNIATSDNVDLVLNMDGFGSRSLKLNTYRTIMRRTPLPFAGFKLFYEQDSALFTPEQVMALQPVPSVVIYQ